MGYSRSIEGYQHGWKYWELYAPVTKSILGPLDQPPMKIPDELMYSGEVHLLQEAGMKMRAIASPYRIHQLALKPLGDAIYRIIKYLKWDCTFDQTKSIPYIQDALRAGKTVHSVDLSGATDYFPLELQSLVLREIFGDVLDISLFEEISRSRWKSEIGDIQWKRGQPLGLYPSFGAFTLTHGLLLYYLLGKKYENEFFVVGDDVVIIDDDLYKRYINILDIMSCPWSPSKSISSNSLAEFAGKIVLDDRVIPSYKWRKISNKNFLDICRNLGPRSRSLLSRRQRAVFDVVKHLLPPLGLNYSYPGSNLTKMVIETDSVLSRIQERGVRSLVGLTETIHRNLYGSSLPYLTDPEQVNEIRTTLDERVASVFQQTVVHRLTAMWHMFADLPQALSLEPRLPVEAPLPRGTTLDWYEELLRLSKQS
jgi:hypothetical protein